MEREKKGEVAISKQRKRRKINRVMIWRVYYMDLLCKYLKMECWNTTMPNKGCLKKGILYMLANSSQRILFKGTMLHDFLHTQNFLHSTTMLAIHIMIQISDLLGLFLGLFGFDLVRGYCCFFDGFCDFLWMCCLTFELWLGFDLNTAQYIFKSA